MNLKNYDLVMHKVLDPSFRWDDGFQRLACTLSSQRKLGSTAVEHRYHCIFRPS